MYPLELKHGDTLVGYNGDRWTVLTPLANPKKPEEGREALRSFVHAFKGRTVAVLIQRQSDGHVRGVEFPEREQLDFHVELG